MKTTKEIATRVVGDVFKSRAWTNDELVNAITTALDEREREVREACAEIAESGEHVRMVGGSTGDAWGTAKAIAAAVRHPTTQEGN